MSVRVVAIDPAVAKSCAVAWRNYKAWHAHHGDGVSQGVSVRGLLYFARDDGVTHCAIEAAYLGPNARTYGDLCRVQGELQALARDVGLIPALVPASRWQPAILTVGGHLPRTRKELKWRSVWVAERLTGVRLSDDLADAVCMAEACGCDPGLMEGV